jgi:pantoate--beta-alanine ligase
MEVITKIKEMQIVVDYLRASGKKIACVPTMGYLHEGHLSLVKRAKEIADVVIVTLFVNPTQFGPNEDYNRYPRDFAKDKANCEQAGVDFILHPEVQEMYPSGYNTEINIREISKKFEGAFRPIHFNGVATIVSKLFMATKPHYALFGQKDYQQTLVIKQMARDLLIDVAIVIAPTIRELDGLAKSSRNIFLSESERKNATNIYKALELAAEEIHKGEKRRKVINGIMHNVLRSAGAFHIDYAMSADADTLDEPEEFLSGQRIVLLIAAYLGKTRLIDNYIVSLPSSISSRPERFENF